MKKYIIYSLTFIFGAFLFVSCEDVMDTKPKASFDEEAVWSTEASANAFAVGVYNGAIGYLYGGGANWESATPNGSQVSQVGEGINHLATELGLSAKANYGFNRFARLRACNLLIQKATESKLPEQVKRQLIAEGKFLRGCIFFDQTRKMGRFVPIMEVLNPEDSLKFKVNATKSVVESYELIMKDLTDAAYGMPATSSSGRANKYAAHLIRSRAALQAYAYTTNKSYLDTCIVSANAVIQSGKYALTTNYGSLFNHESPTNNEIILAKYFLAEDFNVSHADEMQRVFANVNADDNNISLAEPRLKYPNGKFFHGWSIYWPTQDLVDQYLVTDETTQEALPWDQTSQFKNNVDKLNPNSITTVGAIDSYKRTNGESRSIPSTQDLKTGRTDYPLFREHLKIKSGSTKNISDVMYKNRDKRFYATILHDNSTFFGEHLTMNLNGNFAQGVRDKEDGGWYVTATNYYWRKGIYENISLASADTKTNYHYVIARLGEAYLNLAEAQLLKGNISDAVKALNETRVKHGGLAPSSATTEAKAWEDYLRERRVEMAEENGDIYFSYLRWGKYGGYANYGSTPGEVIKDLNRPVYKIQISRDRMQALIGQLTLLDSWNRNFTTRRYLFPIPQSELDKRAIYGIYDEQNSGW
ncbi:MAG: RagB/SusD family nutrient uptake outer membrane protein [Bacteroidia bacterium]|nr:RagB/SusD family nutrient uptake outer membrane protein [Bacteroidia bacterium]